MNKRTVISILLALVFGFQNQHVIAWLWGAIVNPNPISSWLIQALFGNDYLFYPAIYTHDVVINILLATPLALLISQLSVDRTWPYFLAAIVPFFIYSNFALVGSEVLSGSWHKILLAWFMELCSAPIAYYFLKRVHIIQTAT